MTLGYSCSVMGFGFQLNVHAYCISLDSRSYFIEIDPQTKQESAVYSFKWMDRFVYWWSSVAKRFWYKSPLEVVKVVLKSFMDVFIKGQEA